MRLGEAKAATEQVGIVELMHADDFANGRSTQKYYLKTDAGELVPLDWVNPNNPSVAPGSRVSVVDQKITVLSQPALAAVGVTPKKVAVIMFNFSNLISQMTVQQAQQKMFDPATGVAAYFKEDAFGNDVFSGDVYGWYTLPLNIDAHNSTCDYGSWATMAKAIVVSQGVDLSSYTNFVYTFPAVYTCPGGGWVASIAGNEAWLLDISFVPSRVSHELGHELGVNHASTLTCTDGGQTVAISPTCTSAEYGDPFDVMGLLLVPKHTNIRSKQIFGWLPTANMQTVTSGEGMYTLAPMEQSASGVQMIKIPRSANDYYYLEYRYPFGFDNPGGNGVYVRIGNDNAVMQSQLIDTTPETPGVFTDAALGVGKTFFDPSIGMKIQTTEVTSTKATVAISLPVPTPPAGCFYQQVQCLVAPCAAILVCSTPTPTPQPVTVLAPTTPTPTLIPTPTPKPTSVPALPKTRGREWGLGHRPRRLDKRK